MHFDAPVRKKIFPTNRQKGFPINRQKEFPDKTEKRPTNPYEIELVGRFHSVGTLSRLLLL